MAGAHVRCLPVLLRRPGEPLRPSTLHRVHERWRVCDGSHRGCALCVSAWRERGRCRVGPLAVRGADRLAFVGDGRPGNKLGLYGFGAAAHIVAQVAAWQGRSVFAFTRPGDTGKQAFARRLGVAWAGGSDSMPPERLDAAIIFATAGELVPRALEAVRKGGRVVCGGIHMSDIPSFPYRLLWEERQIVSVANLTRQDGIDFLGLAPGIGIDIRTTRYPARGANRPWLTCGRGALTAPRCWFRKKWRQTRLSRYLYDLT